MSDTERVPPVRPDGLQLRENRGFNERLWVIKRIAWVVFALIVVAAGLGLMGSGGPLARASLPLAGGAIEYPRVSRWQASDNFELSWSGKAGKRRVRFGGAFLRTFQLESITPQPISSLSGADGLTLAFDQLQANSGAVELDVRPRRYGPVSFDVAIDGGAPASVSVLILP